MEWLDITTWGCCASRAQLGEDVQARVGVGIAFDTSGAGEGRGLRVNHIKPRSSADKSGRIQQEDRLCSIDHQDVRWHSAGQIAPFILGEAGTRVRLGFERPGPPPIPYEVVLTRGGRGMGAGSS
mmetsp:Transcript_42659/g.104131  ORF Transcript_42659/g.104131 Transcript_42659/m.104131 type:complete len:125 (-) Transcript_42659:837-1211(-)